MPKWLKDNFANVAGHVPLKPKPNVLSGSDVNIMKWYHGDSMNDRVALEALDTTLYGKLKSNPLPILDPHISRSNIKFCCFLLKILEDISGGTDTAILDFWCICPGFKSQGVSLTSVLPCLCAMNSSDSPLVRHLLTSLMANMATKPFFDPCTCPCKHKHW